MREQELIERMERLEEQIARLTKETLRLACVVDKQLKTGAGRRAITAA